MDNRYNLYNLEASFRNFLVAENVATATLKNYLSDFRHYLGWIQQAKDLKVTNETIFTKAVVTGYLTYLNILGLPLKSINRRLSTLRKFGSFCISQGWTSENPAKHVSNLQLSEISIDKIVVEFEETHTPLQSAQIKEFLTVINL